MMETLAHVALWDTGLFGDCASSAIISIPRTNPEFSFRLRLLQTHARVMPDDSYIVIVAATVGLVRQLMSDFFPTVTCPICIRFQNPCWWWREDEDGLALFPGSLRYSAMPTPAAGDEERQLALVSSNALDQLVGSSADLRTAMRNIPPTLPPPRRRAQPTQQITPRAAREVNDLRSLYSGVPSRTQTASQTPTPSGTIRCTHCNQVIPPGFTKETDPKKTEDEIYAACKHEFDPDSKICLRCQLPERPSGSRFSWLEVD